jgi:hypothetical protein
VKVFLAALALLPLVAGAQTAGEIMASVAKNQSRAEAARASYIYQQNVLVRMKRGDGKLAREEDREYIVTPEPGGLKREMTHFAGKYGVNGKEYAVSEPGEHYRDKDIDANVVKNLADSFGNDEKSRDGLNRDLFPLAEDKQHNYVFKLTGTENYRGHEVFRVTFEPGKRPKETHQKREQQKSENDFVLWAGEALIDKADLTPVLITTHLAKSVPILVKTLLGTNIEQIGFKVSYEKFEDGLWFPVTYGGEFKLRILFAYSRTISLNLENSDFRKANINSTVTYDQSIPVPGPQLTGTPDRQ